MHKKLVTVLQKPEGRAWTPSDFGKFSKAGLNYEFRQQTLARLVVVDPPEGPMSKILGHGDFVQRDHVPYPHRWDGWTATPTPTVAA